MDSSRVKKDVEKVRIGTILSRLSPPTSFSRSEPRSWTCSVAQPRKTWISSKIYWPRAQCLNTYAVQGIVLEFPKPTSQGICADGRIDLKTLPCSLLSKFSMEPSTSSPRSTKPDVILNVRFKTTASASTLLISAAPFSHIPMDATHTTVIKVSHHTPLYPFLPCSLATSLKRPERLPVIPSTNHSHAISALSEQAAAIAFLNQPCTEVS